MHEVPRLGGLCGEGAPSHHCPRYHPAHILRISTNSQFIQIYRCCSIDLDDSSDGEDSTCLDIVKEHFTCCRVDTNHFAGARSELSDAWNVTECSDGRHECLTQNSATSYFCNDKRSMFCSSV